jgi:hypothetical protein
MTIVTTVIILSMVLLHASDAAQEYSSVICHIIALQQMAAKI